MRAIQRYTWSGFILGWGAPLGALAVRYIWAYTPQIETWLAVELRTHLLLYVYMTASTSLVFALFGLVLGRKTDLLAKRNTLLEKTSEDLHVLSMTDGLTGLYTHRYLQERLELEIERSQRYQNPLSVLMIDVDDFKRLNDTFGHLLGDRALKLAADVMQECVRKVDVVGRYGGEEFLVILPQTGPTTAFEVAERVRQGIAKASLIDDAEKNVGITVTIGIASLPRMDLTGRTTLLKAADEALYEGKRLGKNCVHVSSMTPIIVSDSRKG